jgi:hypothetical protein
MIFDKVNQNSVSLDIMPEYQFVYGSFLDKIYYLELNSLGRWRWKNVATHEPFLGYYTSRQDAIVEFPGECQGFRTEDSILSYIRDTI